MQPGIGIKQAHADERLSHPSIKRIADASLGTDRQRTTDKIEALRCPLPRTRYVMPPETGTNPRPPTICPTAICAFGPALFLITTRCLGEVQFNLI